MVWKISCEACKKHTSMRKAGDKRGTRTHLAQKAMRRQNQRTLEPIWTRQAEQNEWLKCKRKGEKVKQNIKYAVLYLRMEATRKKRKQTLYRVATLEEGQTPSKQTVDRSGENELRAAEKDSKDVGQKQHSRVELELWATMSGQATIRDTLTVSQN